ncbi:MAG: PucR family transcriptional regulator ligand-binding domain-containing protein [Actinobacteria bacterium]|nr:PucR family transcriptional regulator ligand-binding domain-containing protein [Actinomycetota bacterium]
MLSAPVFRDAEVLAGGDYLDAAELRWITVIEGPVENFIRPGELVLTTCVGCDRPQLVQMVAEIAAAGAAALCISLPEQGEIETVPEEALAAAAARRMPVLTLPWEVRFAEVIMAVTDRIIAKQHAAALAEPDQLLASVATAALEGAGLAAVAEALETMIERAIVILAPSLHLLAHGALARQRLGRVLDGWESRLTELSAEEAARIELSLSAETASWVEAVPSLGLGPGMAVGARAGRRVVAIVYAALDDDRAFIPTLEGRALSQSAIAVAMEMLRMRAAVAAEERLLQSFVWSLADGAAPTREVAARAVLLGHDLQRSYRVTLGRADGEAAATSLAEGIGAELGKEGIAAARGELVLALLPDADPRSLRALVVEFQERQPGSERASWGVVEEPAPLADLRLPFRRAERLLELGRVLHGAGTVADDEQLGAAVLLGALAEDAEAVAAARARLEPLVAYDADSGRDLQGTLEAYLRSHGNTSAAARDLYLNRHSLMYRLKKIESLLDCSLENYEDRFTLNLSLHLLQLAELRARSGSGGSTKVLESRPGLPPGCG